MQAIRTWQGVRDEVLRRIQSRTWKPGDPIPREADLAREFGCARVTVNRALRVLAENGFLDRRRKAGTRVADHPVAKPRLEIPIIRHEIEALGHTHGYRLVARSLRVPPAHTGKRLGLGAQEVALAVTALHTADGRPFVVEDRWINLSAAPLARTADFASVSANEWLIQNAPVTSGALRFSAEGATSSTAAHLACAEEDSLFVIERLTRHGPRVVTLARLLYAPGHGLSTAF